MSNFSSATQDLLWAARRFKGVIDLLPQLEQISSLENTINEANARLEQLASEAASLAEANVEAEQAVKASRKVREDILQEAAIQAAQIKEEALSDARRVMEEALSQINVETDKILNERKSVLLSVENHKNTLKNLQKEIDEETARLSSIREQLNSLKAKF